MVPTIIRNFTLLQILVLMSLQGTSHASTLPLEEESHTCDTHELAGGAVLLATQAVRSKVDLTPADFEADGTHSNSLGPEMDQKMADSMQVVPDLLQTQKLTEYVPVSEADSATRTDLTDSIRNQVAGHPYPIPDSVPDRDKDYVRDDDGPWLKKFYPGKRNVSGSSENTVDENEEPAEKKHVYARYVVAPLAFVFFAVFTLSNIMEKYEITAIPESAILIFFGGLLSVFASMIAEIDVDEEVFSHMMPKILNLVFLPILIFGSGWTIRRQDFFSQFPHILLFAFVGVALSTVVIGSLIYVTGLYNLHGVTQIRTAFVYATLISATDPVATTATYAKLKVEPLLNIMVFGESIINDAVAVVFFNVLNSDHFMMNTHGEAMSGMQLLGSVVWGIAKIFFGSVVIGILLGMAYTIIAHWADMRENKKGQILVILASCYLTYALAESCNMSGIIATMFSGLLMGVYMRPHLSTEGSLLATFFVKQLSTLADAGVFLLVGFSVMQLTTNGWYFGLWVMLFSLIGRAASVYPVGLVVNGLKTAVGIASRHPKEGWNLLSPAHMFMMWHAGLRGGIALALSLELGQWVDVIDGPGTRRTLQTATFLLIVAFLLVFGGSTSFFLKKLGIPLGVDAPPDALYKTEDMGKVRTCLKAIDKKILSPLLLGERWKDPSPDEDEKDVEDLLALKVHGY